MTSVYLRRSLQRTSTIANKLTLKNNFKLKSRARVFSYLVRQEWDKRIVLSKNIIENAISYNKTKINSTVENGWTRLWKFLTEETCSFRNNSNCGISLSVHDTSKREKSKSPYELNLNLQNDDNSEATSSSKSEEAKKYSKETQDLKDKSTNLPSMVEATPAKHSSVKESNAKAESIEK